ACAVDIEVAKRHGGHFVGRADGQEHLLVVALGDGVDRRWRQGLGLSCRDRPKQALLLIAKLPQPTAELLFGAEPRIHDLAIIVAVAALTVRRHGGGDDELADLSAAPGHALEQNGCTHAVHRDITLHLVHGLTDPYSSGEVKHDLDA